MADHRHTPKVTIEDLLHLKRAERPGPEFWVGFERELRQKQLAALVERRSWWHNLQGAFSPRLYLPVGAAAALAFTLFTVRYGVPVFSALQPAVSGQAGGTAAVATAAIPAPVVVAPHTDAAGPQIDDRTAVAANVALSERLPERATQLTPWGAPATTETPSARSVAATIASLEQTQPELANLAMGGRISTGNHLQTATGRSSEFAQVAAVASKRSRLLAQFDDRRFTPEPQAPEVLRERLVRRMAYTEDNSERFNRVDLQANRVLVKF